MIKYALENNYSYYNFYGISSNLSPEDPLYGIYTFKKGFGGEVVELVGEYDKVLSGKYYLYNTAYNIVHSLKKIKAKMHAKK
jgi:peptidoglycan pentaglycine glycine transferase (the first glycine)